MDTAVMSCINGVAWEQRLGREIEPPARHEATAMLLHEPWVANAPDWPHQRNRARVDSRAKGEMVAMSTATSYSSLGVL